MQENDLLQEILSNTKEIKTRLSNVENIVTNHDKQLQNIEKNYGKRLLNIEKNYGERLLNIEKNHGERLQNIENILTRMEKEYGDKIQVLFDYFVDQDQRYKNMQSDITDLRTNVDNQNTRIFALEFYKEEKFASK